MKMTCGLFLAYSRYHQLSPFAWERFGGGKHAISQCISYQESSRYLDCSYPCSVEIEMLNNQQPVKLGRCFDTSWISTRRRTHSHQASLSSRRLTFRDTT